MAYALLGAVIALVACVAVLTLCAASTRSRSGRGGGAATPSTKWTSFRHSLTRGAGERLAAGNTVDGHGPIMLPMPVSSRPASSDGSPVKPPLAEVTSMPAKTSFSSPLPTMQPPSFAPIRAEALQGLRILSPGSHGNMDLQLAFESELKKIFFAPGTAPFSGLTIVVLELAEGMTEHDVVSTIEDIDPSLLNREGRTAIVFAHLRDPDDVQVPKRGRHILGESAYSLLIGTYSLECVDMYWWHGDFGDHRDLNLRAFNELRRARTLPPRPPPPRPPAPHAGDERDDTLDFLDDDLDVDEPGGDMQAHYFGSKAKSHRTLPFTPLERVAEGSHEYTTSSI